MYKLHTHCRACGYGTSTGPSGIKADGTKERLQFAFSLGAQPLANEFRSESQSRSGYVPLEVMLCPRCSLAQLSVVVDPEVLYRDYSYVTSDSQMMQLHFAELRSKLVHIKSTLGTILEIGSNDGKFLSYLASSGGVRWVMGVDPAKNLALLASKLGVPTLTKMWGIEAAEELRLTRTYDTIIARHVFAHVDDWKTFIRSCEIVSNPETVIAIEVPYVGDMIKSKSFDQIYHEHLSYVSIEPIKHLLAGTMFYLDDVWHFGIHGGAIVLVLKRRATGQEIEYQQSENFKLSDWRYFKTEADAVVNQLTGFISDKLSSPNVTICGLGASAKSTVWLNYCGLRKNSIRFICDSTPQKQWRLCPGTDIPVVDEGALLRELPQYCVVFVWNFAEEILRKHRFYLEKGGCFIIPLPSLSTVRLTHEGSEKLEIATTAQKA